MTLLTFRDPSPPLAALRWRLAGWRLSLKLMRLKLALKDGYDPSQPRVPAGQADGGRWAGGVSGSFRVAQATPRGGGSGRGRSGGGRFSETTPAQQARLEISRAQAEAAIARVRERDPKWNPKPSFYETVEGEIATNVDVLRQANERFDGVAPVGPGLFSGGSVPARNPGRSLTAEEQAAINSFGRATGCHTCGSTDPKTRSGNFIPDHQPPSTFSLPGTQQRLFPHCASCSSRQGGYVGNLNNRR